MPNYVNVYNPSIEETPWRIEDTFTSLCGQLLVLLDLGMWGPLCSD